MNTPSNPTIEFLVHGRALGAVRSASGRFAVDGNASAERPAGLAGIPGRLKQAVEVGANRGADGAAVLLIAEPGRDFVVLTIENGPTLVLHPEHARDLLRSQQPDTDRSPSSAPARPPGSDPGRSAPTDPSRPASSDPVVRGPVAERAIRVPSSLSWAAGSAPGGKTRGLLGKAIIKLIAVVTGKALGDGAAALTAAAVTRSIDGRVDEGVYRIGTELPESFNDDASRSSRVPDGKLGGTGAPVLVLVHGTFVDTPSTFGKLWRSQRAAVDRLAGRYGTDGLFAFDHATLGRSPIENALTLIRACATGARLHLLTHSRGGLVAEVVARACAHGKAAKAELELFEGPDDQRAALAALYDLAARKRVRVERIVRVACPSRGTLLASERLDAALSVLKWALELTGLPVAPELVAFLAEVAQQRRRPDELPGIEAMMPGSSLVRWIHACPTPVPGELRVLAGDMEGDSLTSWVKTLASDAFFWTDNDLVVQTRSMYGGATRVGDGSAGAGATFVLERGGQISHFTYFSDRQCVEGITAALVEDEPPRFAPIGPLSAAGNEADGRRARIRAGGADVRATGRADVRAAGRGAPVGRPAVFLLPGILGSHIARDGKRIWFAPPFVDGLDRLAWSEDTDARFSADGTMGVYDALIERLERHHEVIPFPFDWRRPIQEEARRLAAAIEAALDARKDSGAAVRLLAHSMGGLVARTVEIVAPQTWKRLMADPGARLVMLATPNAGTWAPMQVLTGDDDFGNTIAAIGSLFDDVGARRVIAGMPGLFQMQAGLLDPELRLADAERWSEMAAADRAWLEQASVWHSGALGRPYYAWSAPPQPVLDKAVELRRKLDAQLGGLPTDRLVTVLGTETWTPAGFRFGTDGLEYELRRDCGDGRITDTAAMLPGVPAWRVDRGHVDMVTSTRHFAAYEELLTSGRTASLPCVADPGRTGTGAAGRSAAVRQVPDAILWQRPARTARALPPPTLQKQGIDGGALVPVSSPSEDGDRLAITVVCGDIRFTNSTLLIGHYDTLNLVGAEDIVDGLLGGALKKALQVRLYPDLPGTHRIFFNHRTDPANPWDRPRPPQVAVLGLGAEGSLRPAQLTQTVRQAVIGCGQRLAEDCAGSRSAAPRTFDLCATLMGSGGTGISPGQSAQLIAQGIREANEKLRDVGWPRVRQLEVVELYLDRAAEAWRALQMLAKSQPRRFAIEWLKQGTGGLRRPADSGYRAARYDFLSAVSGMAPNGESVIQYTIDSRRARTELQAQTTQGRLLTQLVGDASSDILKNPRIGRSLFKLLVPFELEPWFGGDGAVMIEVDATTAAIPWELLDADEDGDDPERKPWAVRTKLVRRLRTPNYRLGPVDASTEDLALVVGDPDCDRSVYPVLEGARDEARVVARTLKDQLSAEKVRELIASDGENGRIGPQEVVNAMLESSYRVIHIAGHGEPNEPDKDGKPGTKKGVVLRDGVFIGANEVRAMRKVPELVFLNCCYLGAYSAEQLSKPEFYNRSAFAAGVADELIRVGVRCVIAAGWAVDDNAAQEFATRFYQSLLGGDPFIDAVQAGRLAAWSANPKSNTWAAYQCYGDPGWKWRGEDGEASAGDGEAVVASSLGLAMELEQLTTVIRYRRDSDGRYAKLVRRLRDEFESRWGNEGQVAEAFASAYAALEDVDEALKWYGRAMAAPDGTTSMRAALTESRMLIERVGGAPDVDVGRQQLVDRIAQLEGLDAISGTAERAELLGTAWRHLARIEARRGEGRLAEQLEALAKAEHYFAKAVARCIAEENPTAQLWPAASQLGVALRARLLARSDDATAIEFSHWQRAESLLAERNAQAPDFDTKVGAIVLTLMRAVDGGRVAASASNLGEAFRGIHERLPDPARWSRVLDEVEFFLRPWCDLPSQLPREKRAASELLRRLGNYAGRPDEGVAEPYLPSTPQESMAAPAATTSATPEGGAKVGHRVDNGGDGEPGRRRPVRGPDLAGRAGDRGRSVPPRRTAARRGTIKQ